MFFNQTFTAQSPVGGGWEVWNAVNNAVRSGNYFLTLGIRERVSLLLPYWYIAGYDLSVTSGQPCVDLIINFTTPNNYYTFKNKIQTSENYDSLILNNNLQNPIPSGSSPVFLPWGSQNSVRTNVLPFIVNWNNTNTVQKHNYWDLQSDSAFSLHYNFEAISSSPSELKSTFLSTAIANIKNYALEMSSSSAIGNINLKDPWFYYKDQNNNWFHTNEFNNYSSPLNIQNNSSTSYGGVFLNQGLVQGQWTPPYYSVKVDQVQDDTLYTTGAPLIGRNHKFYFQNWSGTNANFQNSNLNETPVVFTLDNAVVQANLKSTQLSNTAFNGNSSQRTFIKDDALGYLHNIYCSMGKIYYERSTDNGTTWYLMNGGKPFNPSINAKSPSICQYSGENKLYVTYQASGTWWPEIETDGILVTVFPLQTSDDVTPLATMSVQVPDFNYSIDYRPVIAAHVGCGAVIYDMPSTYTAGLKGFYFLSYYDGLSNSWELTYNGDVIFPANFIDQNSSNPSIAADYTRTHLVFEQGQTQVKYVL